MEVTHHHDDQQRSADPGLGGAARFATDPKIWCVSTGGLFFLGLFSYFLSKAELRLAHQHMLVNSAAKLACAIPCDWPVNGPPPIGLVHVEGCAVTLPQNIGLIFSGFEEVLPIGGIHAPWARMYVEQAFRGRTVEWRPVSTGGLHKFTEQMAPEVRLGSYVLDPQVTRAIEGQLLPLRQAKWQNTMPEPPLTGKTDKLNSSTMKLSSDGIILYDGTMDYRVYFEVANASRLSVLAAAERPPIHFNTVKLPAILSVWSTNDGWRSRFAMVRTGHVSMNEMLGSYIQGMDTLGWVVRLFFAAGFVPAVWCALWPVSLLDIVRGHLHLGGGSRALRDPSQAASAERQCYRTCVRAAGLGCSSAALVASASWFCRTIGSVHIGVSFGVIFVLLAGVELLCLTCTKTHLAVVGSVEYDDVVRVDGGPTTLEPQIEQSFVNDDDNEFEAAQELAADSQEQERFPGRKVSAEEETRFAACLCASILLPTATIIAATIVIAQASEVTETGVVT